MWTWISPSCLWQTHRFETPEQDLIFSYPEDTLRFDTLLTGKASITKRFRVKNPNPGAVLLRKLGLEKESESPFFIYVDGEQAKVFERKSILGRDSMLVLINVFLDGRSKIPFPYKLTERFFLEIEKGKRYILPLSVWGQDVRREEDLIISDEEIWVQEELPVWIGRRLLVESAGVLQIKEGVRIFFQQESYIEVQGRLLVEGTSKNPVSFRSDRLDEKHKDTPGQWKGIRLLSAKPHHMRFVHIENAETGIQVGEEGGEEQVELSLSQVQIRNMRETGILSYGAQIEGKNMLVYNCGSYLLQHLNG
ncbi:MAG: hypothetical protein OXB93_07315, partial [Cytophagales bacterium]|nr:hypothetical protein [Cytophagales bacterium]